MTELEKLKKQLKTVQDRLRTKQTDCQKASDVTQLNRILKKIREHENK